MKTFVWGVLVGLAVSLLLLWRVDDRVGRVDARLRFLEGYLTTRLNTNDILDWRKGVEHEK